MSKYLDVAAIQFQVSERNDQGRDEAFRQFHEAEERLDGTGVDLVVTCEGMESLSQKITDAESFEHPGELLTLYRDFAIRNKCTVVGSVKLKEDGKVYNAQAYIGPDGAFLGRYRKSFPTLGEIEHGLTAGPGAEVVETPAGRLGGVICYDLNFNSLIEGYHKLHPDILCFSSMFHGGQMQNDWAYRARSFFIGSVKDCVSTVIDPLGRVLAESCYYNRIAFARINTDRFIMHQDLNNEKFTDIRRKYKKEVLLDVSSAMGVAVLYSCSPERTALDIAKEFELIQLDDRLRMTGE